MGYRDEREALRQRIEELEGELSEARRALEGGEATRPEDNLLLGGPSRLLFERRIEGSLSEDTVAQLISRLRTAVGEVGRTEQLGRTTTWRTDGRSGRFVELTLEPGDGGTILRLSESLRGLGGALFGGVFGGLGGGGTIVPMLPMFFGYGVLLPYTIPLWFLAVYLFTRRVYRWRSHTRHRALGTVADQLVTVAERAPREPPRARVEVGVEVEEPDEGADAARAPRGRSTRRSG